jgi:hypothetical protein
LADGGLSDEDQVPTACVPEMARCQCVRLSTLRERASSRVRVSTLRIVHVHERSSLFPRTFCMNG